jgi:hypothetical protein
MTQTYENISKLKQTNINTNVVHNHLHVLNTQQNRASSQLNGLKQYHHTPTFTQPIQNLDKNQKFRIINIIQKEKELNQHQKNFQNPISEYNKTTSFLKNTQTTTTSINNKSKNKSYSSNMNNISSEQNKKKLFTETYKNKITTNTLKINPAKSKIIDGTRNKQIKHRKSISQFTLKLSNK